MKQITTLREVARRGVLGYPLSFQIEHRSTPIVDTINNSILMYIYIYFGSNFLPTYLPLQQRNLLSTKPIHPYRSRSLSLPLLSPNLAEWVLAAIITAEKAAATCIQNDHKMSRGTQNKSLNFDNALERSTDHIFDNDDVKTDKKYMKRELKLTGHSSD